MTQTIIYILICINIVTFVVYGIDKWRSTSGRLLPTGRKKAKQGSWRTQTGWIDDDFAKGVIPIIPMGKLIQPQDITETILFLASEQAKMLTGQVIKVSGGHAL